MSLYYDTRIRPVVIERWDEAEATNADLASLQTPEDQFDPEDSVQSKDPGIPLSFKNRIAQELYDAEGKAIKEVVRSQQKADLLMQTVYNASEEDRLELVREYQR